eukprot:COSAG01_NODE_32233_length_584_cov_1.296907_1_plen_102_part_10
MRSVRTVRGERFAGLYKRAGPLPPKWAARAGKACPAQMFHRDGPRGCPGLSAIQVLDDGGCGDDHTARRPSPGLPPPHSTPQANLPAAAAAAGCAAPGANAA